MRYWRPTVFVAACVAIAVVEIEAFTHSSWDDLVNSALACAGILFGYFARSPKPRLPGAQRRPIDEILYWLLGALALLVASLFFALAAALTAGIAIAFAIITLQLNVADLATRRLKQSR